MKLLPASFHDHKATTVCAQADCLSFARLASVGCVSKEGVQQLLFSRNPPAYVAVMLKRKLESAEAAAELLPTLQTR